MYKDGFLSVLHINLYKKSYKFALGISLVILQLCLCKNGIHVFLSLEIWLDKCFNLRITQSIILLLLKPESNNFVHKNRYQHFATALLHINPELSIKH